MKAKEESLNEAIARFWDEHPLAADFLPPLSGAEFFKAYDNYKFKQEPHILEELRQINFKGKKVLEIGVGHGAEGQKMIEAGAIYTGIDLSPANIARMKDRCRLFSLPYEELKVMRAETLSFPDNYFDLVFSHGVLHHSPEIEKIIAEIYRVLKPGGQVVVMLYHRHSLNYHLSIRLLRRLGLLFLWVPGLIPLISKLTGEKEERIKKHWLNFRQQGWAYLKMASWLSRSTDGPDNVYSRVFSREEARRLFAAFEGLTISVHHLNERHLLCLRYLLPGRVRKWLAARLGWHLWIKGYKPCCR